MDNFTVSLGNVKKLKKKWLRLYIEANEHGKKALAEYYLKKFNETIDDLASLKKLKKEGR